MNINVEITNCDLCGEKNYSPIYQISDLRYAVFDQEYTVVSCKNCGHQFLNPRPTQEDIPKTYPALYYKNRDHTVSKQNTRYFKQAQYFPLKENGTFLDIGCAGGAFAETMRKLGWKSHGTDFINQLEPNPSPEIEFKFGQLNEVAYPSNHFDGISAWGVFEHLTSPKTYFHEVSRILKPTGLFVMMVPNAKSLWSRFAFKEDIPRHLHFFTLPILEKYAQDSGLSIIRADFSNNIYSTPATGRDGFRINLLRLAGVPWSEINNPPKTIFLKLLSKFGSLLGKLLIHPKIEEIFGLTGMMVISLKKNNY